MKTQDIGPQPAQNTRSNEIDIEVIIEQIWSDLEGTTSRSEIRKTLMEAASAYKGARIKTYVPIFLRRDVLRRLQDSLPHERRAIASEPENSAAGKEVDSAAEETTELAKQFPGTALMLLQSG